MFLRIQMEDINIFLAGHVNRYMSRFLSTVNLTFWHWTNSTFSSSWSCYLFVFFSFFFCYHRCYTFSMLRTKFIKWITSYFVRKHIFSSVLFHFLQFLLNRIWIFSVIFFLYINLDIISLVATLIKAFPCFY